MKTHLPYRFILSFLLLTIVPNAYSQEQKTPEERAAAITAWMKTNLQLTADQEDPIQTVNLKYANLNEGLKTSTQPRRAKLNTLKSNQASKEKELKAILTDEQFKTYKAKEAEMREKFREEAERRKGQ